MLFEIEISSDFGPIHTVTCESDGPVGASRYALQIAKERAIAEDAEYDGIWSIVAMTLYRLYPMVVGSNGMAFSSTVRSVAFGMDRILVDRNGERSE